MTDHTFPKNDASNQEHKTKDMAGQQDGGTDMPAGAAGEDEGSAPIDGDDSHLKDDQKPLDH